MAAAAAASLGRGGGPPGATWGIVGTVRPHWHPLLPSQRDPSLSHALSLLLRDSLTAFNRSAKYRIEQDNVMTIGVVGEKSTERSCNQWRHGVKEQLFADARGNHKKHDGALVVKKTDRPILQNSLLIEGSNSDRSGIWLMKRKTNYPAHILSSQPRKRITPRAQASCGCDLSIFQV